jgi:hypothetical protein
MKTNFTLIVTGQASQGFETLPSAFLAANKIPDKSKIRVDGPYNRSYNWTQLLQWAKDAEILDRDGNINKRALKRK